MLYVRFLVHLFASFGSQNFHIIFRFRKPGFSPLRTGGLKRDTCRNATITFAFLARFLFFACYEALLSYYWQLRNKQNRDKKGYWGG